MNELAKQNNTLAVAGMSQDQKELLKRTICRGSTDDEFQLFVGVCNRTGLDPFTRQVYAIKRWDSSQGKEVMGIQVSIDGFRLVAERTGEYEGQTITKYCDENGAWTEIWTKKEPPYAASVGVYRKGFREALYATAKWDSYAQRKKDGSLTQMWMKFQEVMLAKCAESLALRKAFPQELSGLYTTEEMSQAQVEPRRVSHSEHLEVERNSGEVGDDDRETEVIPPKAEPPKDEEPPKERSEFITEKQRRRLWAIGKTAGVSPQQIKDYLGSKGIDSSEKIKWRDYEAICGIVEQGIPVEAK